MAELARLIGQNDPFAEYGRQNQALPPEPPPAPQPPRVSSEWADHVAADAGYIPPPAAPPPGMQQAGGYPPPPGLHPAEYSPAAYEHGVPGYTGGEGGYEPESYYPNAPLPEGEDQHFYDDVPPRRRMGILGIAAVFALAVVGTAGAFGYRAIFGSSAPSGPPPVIKADSKPAKIVPAKKTKDAKNGKFIYDRVAEHGQDEKLVSREEQPIAMNGKPAGVVLPHDQNGMPSGSILPGLGSGVVGVQPKKVHTIAIRPDGTVLADAAPKGVAPKSSPPLAAPPASAASSAFPPPAASEKSAAHASHEAMAEPAKPAAKPAPHHAAARPAPREHHVAAVPRNAPLSLNPNQTQQPMHTARAPQPAQPAPAAAAGGYAVQVASRHNKADAEASLQHLQAKFGSQLGGHHTMVRRVDLGGKGIYYRAMVGPFANSQAAHQMCSRLKAAGGNCFVQRI
ncbi:MAG: SPOR domain-containing protein [Pseudolabrys sp.]